jgi:hypothetical protein
MYLKNNYLNVYNTNLRSCASSKIIVTMYIFFNKANPPPHNKNIETIHITFKI